MDARADDLTVPLLVDEKWQTGFAQKVEEVESPDYTGDYHKGCTSFFKTCFNGFNALSGVGILSTPFALASGGWLSLVFLFVIAIVTFYSGILIKRCMDSDPSIQTYPDIGHRAFGRKGQMIIAVFMYLELYLVATGFLILEGDNLLSLFPNVDFGRSGFLNGKQCIVLIVALIVLPTVWVDNLSILSYVSASGVVASGIIVLSIFWTGAINGVGFQHKGKFVNWSGIPTAISLYSFCYCAHPVFPTLYNSMKKKHQFSNVLVVCFILCTLGYASMAIMGYLMFGDNVQSQITLDLPVGKLSSRIAIYTTLVNPICKYALMVTPIVNAAKQLFPWSHKKRTLRVLIGTALVVNTVLVAIYVPFFGYLMSLVGAFLSMTASIILPGACYLKITGKYRRVEFESIVIGIIILLGAVAAVFGTYTALEEIAVHM